jgi:FAD/FMN-containing dehydrogenase
VQFSAGGRAALGVLYFHLIGNIDRHANVLAQLRRAAAARGGSVVVMKREGDSPLDDVDRWGEIGDGWPLMQAVKARFDPKGTLNPGAGPGGL